MIFKNGFRITQEFGNKLLINGKDYYAQFGLNGHNGIDIVPKDNDWFLYSTFDGTIMIMKYDAGYGNRIAIWNKEKMVTEYFNHLEYIDRNLHLYKDIKKGTLIGKMGNTGNSFGAHLHYALAMTDKHGNRINRNNGYAGYYDPKNYLTTGVL